MASTLSANISHAASKAVSNSNSAIAQSQVAQALPQHEQIIKATQVQASREATRAQPQEKRGTQVPKRTEAAFTSLSTEKHGVAVNVRSNDSDQDKTPQSKNDDDKIDVVA